MKIIGNRIVWDEDDGVGLSPVWVNPNDPFKGPALWHDFQYVMYKDSKSRTRKDIDIEFYNKMLVVAEFLSNGNSIRYLGLKLRAMVYYTAVRTLGAIAWNRKENAIR